ncbi:MAG: TlpA disulfide reductase family protein [Microthrixaceae bacterium]
MTNSTEPAAPNATHRRSLPVGPLGLLAITAVALCAAFAAGWLFLDATGAKNQSQAIDVQDMLNGVGVAPLVANPQARAELNFPAPDARLEFLDGSTEQLSQIAGIGTPVLLNFWSSTCAPCLNELPEFEKVSQEFAGKLTVIGIDSQDTVESGQKMVDQTGITFRNARDPKGEISTVFGALALPRTVLIDAQGKVAATYTGELNQQTLQNLLSENGISAS